MTKKLFMALVALFLVVLAGKAQNNTYRMTIQMTDGTIINVGPNDMKNINFVDGQLTVSGVSIDSLLTEMTKMKQREDSICAEVQLNWVMSQAYFVESNNNLMQGLADTKAELIPMIQFCVTTPEFEERVAALRAEIKEVMARVNDLEQFVYSQK